MSPWGPSANHPLGFVAYQQTLGGGPSFSGTKSTITTLGDRLVALITPELLAGLSEENRALLNSIDREKTWLLSDAQKTLLMSFSSQ